MREAWKGAERASARFAAQALEYDRYRPRYPDKVFDVLVHETRTARGDKVVEIGAGTGIATQPLADLGLEVIAVEPAHEMATLAAAKLSGKSRVVLGRFEYCALPDRINVLTAFNSWHWVEPRAGLERASRLLQGGGWIALVWTEVVAWGPARFEERLADVFGDPWPKRWENVVGSLQPVIDDDRFGSVRTFHHPFSRMLDADTYVAVSRTYGGQRSDEKYEMLRRVIADEFAGSVVKVEDAVLHLARRQ
jgi:SAM-dependent methyltransferase